MMSACHDQFRLSFWEPDRGAPRSLRSPRATPRHCCGPGTRPPSTTSTTTIATRSTSATSPSRNLCAPRTTCRRPHSCRCSRRRRAVGRRAVDTRRDRRRPARLGSGDLAGQGARAGHPTATTEVIVDALPGHPVGLLAGPNIAGEVARGYAAAAVVATEDDHIANALHPLFASGLFRVYRNNDVLGCELGGILKNVIAIAAGMAEGLGVGDNTRAMVLTRGLAEMTRLGVAMGADPSHVRGAHRHRRPDRDVHEPTLPQPSRRRTDRRGQHPGAGRRDSRPGRRGHQDHAHGDGAGAGARLRDAHLRRGGLRAARPQQAHRRLPRAASHRAGRESRGALTIRTGAPQTVSQLDPLVGGERSDRPIACLRYGTRRRFRVFLDRRFGPQFRPRNWYCPDISSAVGGHRQLHTANPGGRHSRGRSCE